MAYNVYLCDILGGIPDSKMKLELNSILAGYFNRVASRTHYGSAFVRWLADRKPPVQPHELLIYFMDSTTSILQVMRGGKLAGTLGFGDHWGFTDTDPVSGKTGSEVYNRSTDVRVLANLAFHEAMHNKLGFSNRRLHNGNGLRGSPFRSDADPGGVVTDTTLLTEDNIVAMSGALNKSVPQWTDGIEFLITRGQLKAAGDPMWNA
jgi:hypothetical protein